MDIKYGQQTLTHHITGKKLTPQIYTLPLMDIMCNDNLSLKREMKQCQKQH